MNLSTTHTCLNLYAAQKPPSFWFRNREINPQCDLTMFCGTFLERMRCLTPRSNQHKRLLKEWKENWENVVVVEEATTSAVKLVKNWAILPMRAQTRRRSWPHGKRGKWPWRKAQRRKRKRRRRGAEDAVVVTRKAATEAEVKETKRVSV